MARLIDFDENFKSDQNIPADTVIYNIKEGEFKIYGLYNPKEGSQFRRVPCDVAQNTSRGVYYNHTHTAGGRVRFKTDSSYIVLKAIFPTLCIMPHMAVTGSTSFDIYADNHYYKTFVPPIKYVDDEIKGVKGCVPTFDLNGGYESVVKFDDKKMRDIVINFPLYNDVSAVFIGLEKGCRLESGNEYKHKKPVVYYGSSITQGGCASRPGNSYQAIISRHLDCDFINLGFSGNAQAQPAMYEYISKLDMSVFVYDYDHNSPTKEHYEKTHSEMFNAIREKNPNLPIIMLTRPVYSAKMEDVQKRIEIAYKTYTDAKNSGDNNVYFINGINIGNSVDYDMMTVDGTHPNDFGFYCMAKEIEKVLKDLL